MDKIIYLIVGSLGFTIWLLIGRILIQNPRTSSRQFAGFMAGYLGILVFFMVLLADNDAKRSIIIGCGLLFVNFLVAYPIAYFSFPRIRNWYQK